MPEPLAAQLQAAESAIAFATNVRAYHRRRSPRGSKQRQADLTEAARKISRAMGPLRSYLGKASSPSAPQTTAAHQLTERVRDTSQRLQSERRKVWKMAQVPDTVRFAEGD